MLKMTSLDYFDLEKFQSFFSQMYHQTSTSSQVFFTNAPSNINRLWRGRGRGLNVVFFVFTPGIPTFRGSFSIKKFCQLLHFLFGYFKTLECAVC